MDYLKQNFEKFALVFILLISLTLMIFSSASDSLTVDEKVHISAGYLHTWKGNYLFNSEHPPLLNDLAGFFARAAKPNVPAVPANFTGGDQWEYGDMFFYLSGNNIDKLIFWARLPFIFLTLGLIYLVFLWAKTLFGAKAGLVAATLTAFSPNILAHGRLATTDIGVTFFFLLTCWAIRKYYLKPNVKNAVFLGLAVALVLLSKFSGLVILPIVFLSLMLLWFLKKPKFTTSLGQFLLILAIPLVLVWGTYAFSMRSDLISLPPVYITSKILGYKNLSSPLSKWLIVPYDKAIQGFEILSDHNTSGHWAYLNGEVGYNGWWYYFPLVMLYKLPLTEIILLALTIFIFWKVKLRPPGSWFDYFILFFPPLLFLAISMIGRIDIGIRHILPILPFFYIFISSLANFKNKIFQKLIFVLVGIEVIICILAFPNYLTYFNQIAGGAKGGIKHLSDSNLDWNQNMKRFGIYAKENNIKKVYELCWDGYSFSAQGVQAEILPASPDASQGGPNSPVKGVVVICAQQMVVPPDDFDFGWVTKHPPDTVVGNAMYVWRFDKMPDIN
ncbi:MAG: glycosyltransferase family 39 protein [Patescibacteria group bacterium]|nr:glycosyltransferase family 39 protein [Patescibacteria group bacterium]